MDEKKGHSSRARSFLFPVPAGLVSTNKNHATPPLSLSLFSSFYIFVFVTHKEEAKAHKAMASTPAFLPGRRRKSVVAPDWSGGPANRTTLPTKLHLPMAS